MNFVNVMFQTESEKGKREKKCKILLLSFSVKSIDHISRYINFHEKYKEQYQKYLPIAKQMATF